MNAPTPEGGTVPMMVMVAMIVRATSIAVGWIYHLFNSAVIGILFVYARLTHAPPALRASASA